MEVLELKKAKDPVDVGGKAASLGSLIRGGFNVPDGFVISTKSEMKMTASLMKQIYAQFDKLGAENVAVRSSAVAEDSSGAAWAGQFDTYLNVTRQNLLESVEKCWQSAHSERAKAYAKEKKLKSGPVAVIVQAMVPAEKSGVAFSINPISQDQDVLEIEAVEGLADKLVSGEVTPDSYSVNKKSGKFKNRLSGKKPILSASEIQELAKQIIKLEEFYGFPIDSEWSFANGKLFILQSRPITTTSSSDKQAEMYKTQKSLTEWLEDIKHKDAEVIRREDNDKRERLAVLKKIIGLPFDEPVKFEAADLRDKTAAYISYLRKHGDELCALRLIPKDHSLPKLRMRGKTVSDVYDWFLEQKIDAAKYRAEYIPHAEVSEWSTIFVINKHGIQGELIRGGHYQLTQGFFDSEGPIVFHFDYKKWWLSRNEPGAKDHLKLITKHLHVTDPSKQKQIKKALGGEFFHDYLIGYFETAASEEFGIWFVDYSQSLGNIYANMVIKPVSKQARAIVRGMTASAGKASGPVQIVKPGNLDVEFPKNGVLVCAVTTPEFVPLMQKASAIVTDQGGILSHAAIVARELKKPCIVGAKNATKMLKNDQIVSVNADEGTVN